MDAYTYDIQEANKLVADNFKDFTKTNRAYVAHTKAARTNETIKNSIEALRTNRRRKVAWVRGTLPHLQ